jgi:hypothetical protein
MNVREKMRVVSFLFSFVLILLTLQENRSLATKPFRRTKVSISSLDVPGDEIVH